MALIDVDYQDTLRKAERLDELATKLDNIVMHDLESVYTGVNNSWHGTAADRYKSKERTYNGQIRARARRLRELARGLRQAAERYHRIEMAAKSLWGG